ncbi:gliding motility-associated protein GldE [Flavicella sp.]|uniref:gliding motility-associated protein GldE n=1 Tax=Flavicella sp. TaxID=2957742 RepID=UPI0030188A12
MDLEPILTILNSTPWYFVINIIILISLLMLSAIISGAKVAFFSLNKTILRDLRKTQNTKNKLVLQLLDKPKKLLATILITNNFINVIIVLLFSILDSVFLSGIEENIRFGVEVVSITFLILLFGEVFPKLYASRNSLSFALSVSRLIVVLNKIVTPLSYLLLRLTDIVESRLVKKNTSFSVEALSLALELTSEDATIKDKKNILDGIVAFGSTETVQVMTPRIDIFAIPDDLPFDQMLERIIANGFSRNPVYNESIDEVIGVLYARDLMPHIAKKDFNWQVLIKAPYFIPENKKLNDLLAEFQEKKNHLAIVVDEYGGTSGLVTLEDVIEEIIGEISDEFDTEDLVYSKIDASNYVFEGKIALKDFYKVIDVDPEVFEPHKGKSETIAGFILEITGRFPKRDEKVNFGSFVFVIEAVDRKRVKRIKVTLL